MIYVFDFDGVLFDTVDEIATIGYLSIKNLPFDPQIVPQKFIDFFRINRPRPVDGAGMFIISKFCIDELEKGKEPYLIERDMFYKLYDEQKSKHSILEEKFFNQRAKLRNENIQTWIMLNKPYSKIWEFLKDKDFYIVSNKDISSITLLSKTFNKTLDEEKIFSGNLQGTKAQKLKTIHEKEKQDIIFIDDALDNLIKIEEELPSKHWLTQYLAGWGYINKEDFSLLPNYKNIQLLKDEEFIKIYQK